MTDHDTATSNVVSLSPTKSKSKIEYALEYADQHGWAIFPLWWPLANGQCACGNKSCDKIGKHPIHEVAPNGFHNATNAVEVIEGWWARFPDANIGIATGQRSGLWIVDVDPKNGGLETLARYREDGLVVPTRTVISGSGGYHYYYLHFGSDLPKKINKRTGIDILGEGSYVVAAGSTHASGKSYRWEDERAELEGVPEMWRDVLYSEATKSNRSRTPAVSSSAGGDRGAPLPYETVKKGSTGREAVLLSWCATLRNLGLTEEMAFAAAEALNRDQLLPSIEESEVKRKIRNTANYEEFTTEVPEPEHVIRAMLNRGFRPSVVLAAIRSNDKNATATVFKCPQLNNCGKATIKHLMSPPLDGDRYDRAAVEVLADFRAANRERYEAVCALVKLSSVKPVEGEAWEPISKNVWATLNEHWDCFGGRKELPPEKQRFYDLITRSRLVVDIEDPENTRLVDLKEGQVHPIHREIIGRYLTGKGERERYRLQNEVEAQFIYNPHQKNPLAPTNFGYSTYNLYVPPTWKREQFFFGKPIEHATEPPAIYLEFLNHLTANNEKSREYVLDWLANSVQGWNITYLCLIGEQGIGKGTLAQILRYIHGASNFRETRDQTLKGHFNGALLHKTLVHFDELDIKNQPEALDRLKALANPRIEIERKNKDPIEVDNFANIMISSNKADAFTVEGSDRRFSIIDITDIPLRKTPLQTRRLELFYPENIDKLARYLLFREIKSDMQSPFESERRKIFMEDGLKAWERVALDWAEYQRQILPSSKAEVEFTIEELQEVLIESESSGIDGKEIKAPGRPKIEDLSRRFPGNFKVKKLKTGERVIVITRRGEKCESPLGKTVA